MNGFMSTLLDPQEYCLQGMNYTFSQLLVHTVHLTAQTASCAMNYVSSYCCSSATVRLYNMTKVHQADRTVVRMNDNRIYKNVNLFPQDWHCSRATAKKNISLNNLWNGEVWVLRTHAKSERCFFSNQISASLIVKFIYSEKATKFCEIFTLLLTGTT